MLLISGEKDHTVPWAITNASYKQQSHNKDVTGIVEMPGRGHALTIDSGWRAARPRSTARSMGWSITSGPFSSSVMPPAYARWVTTGVHSLRSGWPSDTLSTQICVHSIRTGPNAHQFKE
jgi:hypothetical protein